MHRPMLTLILLVGGTLSASATEPLRPAELTLKVVTARTGSLLRRDVAWSTKIPLNRTYAELSPEEKATLNSYYEFIGPNDEPPFPRDGLGPIIKAIQQGQEKRLARGEVKMLVTVGADGKAIKTDALIADVGRQKALNDEIRSPQRDEAPICGAGKCKDANF